MGYLYGSDEMYILAKVLFLVAAIVVLITRIVIDFNHKDIN